ncbi:hypothetical protein DPEC_G00078330 [Dallia pectoralis]|uniref:Uncharacterized protein n=1 Tax=Dallia pectoralis TaxID=75939 RepID=A0ACC2H4F2_DALPE|nr:hypothetical protein DPEC_G00078330 [Dallia pectoralis]
MLYRTPFWISLSDTTLNKEYKLNCVSGKRYYFLTRVIMAHSHNPDMFNWKRFTKNKSQTANKVQLNNGDIDQWMKRVEMASDFAVTEVFPQKKPHLGKSSHILTLESTDQLLDHDEAYCEAQALLSDWMNSKLRLELEADEEDVIGSSDKTGPLAPVPVQPLSMDYRNFNDLYSHLVEEEEESSVVNNFLQDLMECDVLYSEDLALDSEERDRRKMRDPNLTMETRHRQVRENRVRRDTERERLRMEKEARRQAREEAQRREQEVERQKKQEARKQEEMLQQEMVQLRREMEERRNLEQLVRLREREKVGVQPGPSVSTASKQKQPDGPRSHRLQEAEAKVQMVNLQCLQRHFSGWYSVLLERRVRMGKAAALCDWKRELRAWRAWRALVWARREQREVERTAEELRTENRRCQVALESDRRRVLRRCLSDWRLWCRAEREHRELLAQQDVTRRKMAALISAVTTGKLTATETPTTESVIALQDADQSKTTELNGQPESEHVGPAPTPACQSDKKLCALDTPTLPWQVTRRHAALTAAERLGSGPQRRVETGERGGDGVVNGGVNPGPLGRGAGWRFEHRHASQQQTIAEQRRLLREQQEQIAHLQEKQSMMGLKQEAQLAQLAIPAGTGLKTSEPKQARVGVVPERNNRRSSVARKPAVVQPCSAVMAMEERARQRAECRREVEKLKIIKEEERLAQLSAAEEDRRREEEENKRRATEQRREERRKEREREEEAQRRLERGQLLRTRAQQHYHTTLLLRRGLAPWKCLVAMNQSNNQLASDHHRRSLLKLCMLSWQQAAGESLAQKQASADRLHQRALLGRSLNAWRRLKDHRVILEERAERFCRLRTLRRALDRMLDHVTRERMAEWERERLAQEHNDRRVVRSCFQEWRQYPGWIREEREREARRERLRRRVAEVLPDFRSSPLEGL